MRNTSGQDRLSFPLFFDPDFMAPMRPLPAVAEIAGVSIARDGEQVAARLRFPHAAVRRVRHIPVAQRIRRHAERAVELRRARQ